MNPEKKAVLDWIDGNTQEIVRIASELIRIPSISGRPDANDRYDELADYLSHELASFGLKAEHPADTAHGGGKNTIATLPGSGGGKTLALGGHCDIVAADEPDWKTEGGFVPTVRDGALIGRGAADMKGGLAACIVAMRAIKECGVSLRGDLQLVATVDEETGSPYGMGYLVEQGFVRPDYFVNAEQTEMEIIVAYKGCFWAEITFTGVTAHGSKPQLGVNAIEKAAEFICAFRQKGLTWEPDPFLGECTVNFGTIHGGTGGNVVPDEVKVVVDVRLVPGQTYDSALEEFRQIIAECKQRDPQFEASIEFCSRLTNAVVIPTDGPLVHSLEESVRTATGKEPVLNSYISAGDNCIFHQMGIPSLMMGPGSVDVIHKSNESVQVEDLIAAAKIYALTAIDLCN